MRRIRSGTAFLPVLLAASCAATSAPEPPGPTFPPGDTADVDTLGAVTTANDRGEDPAGDAGDPAEEEGRPVDEPFIYEVAPGQGYAPQQVDTASTVQVSGSAEVRVPTDRARITFAVETEDSTARGASQANAERMEAVLSAVRDADVADIEIETHGYTLQPRYRRPDPSGSGTREIDGYRATNMIRVTVPEVSAAGRLIDVAVEAGANRVASLAFEASETEEARLAALRDAVGKARREAEAIADAMGVSLGRAMDVQVGTEMPGPRMDFRAEAMQAAPSTPVEPGEQTVSATVTIRYRLDDGGGG